MTGLEKSWGQLSMWPLGHQPVKGQPHQRSRGPKEKAVEDLREDKGTSGTPVFKMGQRARLAELPQGQVGPGQNLASGDRKTAPAPGQGRGQPCPPHPEPRGPRRLSDHPQTRRTPGKELDPR